MFDEAKARRLRWEYGNTRKRLRNARGPMAAQSAVRRMERLADELRAMGCTQDRYEGDWKLPR